jgi:ABC-2 type transport system ATP-binding protein
MSSVIQVNKLTKIFKVYKHHRGSLALIKNLVTRQSRQIRAVDGVSFQVQSGEIVGYIGPNGAGKSTTIKMLTGLLVPTSGEVTVNQYIPWKDRKKYVRHIGAVFGQRTTLWWDLPVIESLELLRHIYNIPEHKYQKNLLEFKNILEMGEFLDTPVRALSLGQRMRADLCAALLHEPQLIFLDEPTIGLDVVAKERIRDFIKFINRQRGVTILLTTHDLTDVEKLCDRIMIIDRGKLLYDGDLPTLNKKFGGKRRLVVDFVDNYPGINIDGAELVSTEERRMVYQFNRNDTSASDLIAMIAQKYRIRDLEVLEPSIDDTIRRIYEDRLLDS